MCTTHHVVSFTLLDGHPFSSGHHSMPLHLIRRSSQCLLDAESWCLSQCFVFVSKRKHRYCAFNGFLFAFICLVWVLPRILCFVIFIALISVDNVLLGRMRNTLDCTVDGQRFWTGKNETKNGQSQQRRRVHWKEKRSSQE